MGTNTTFAQGTQGSGCPPMPDLGLRIVPPPPPIVYFVGSGDAMPAPPMPPMPPMPSIGLR